jgi:hypothetical protein
LAPTVAGFAPTPSRFRVAAAATPTDARAAGRRRRLVGSDPRDFPHGVPVAAISRTDIDLYATQDDGRAATSWWRAGDGWSP